MNIQQTYQDTAREYLLKQKSFLGLSDMNETDFNHIVSLASSVMMTRDSVMMGGSFVQSIVDNNLEQAIGRADNVAIKGLKAFVMVKSWCHVNVTA